MPTGAGELTVSVAAVAFCRFIQVWGWHLDLSASALLWRLPRAGLRLVPIRRSQLLRPPCSPKLSAEADPRASRDTFKFVKTKQKQADELRGALVGMEGRHEGAPQLSVLQRIKPDWGEQRRIRGPRWLCDQVPERSFKSSASGCGTVCLERMQVCDSVRVVVQVYPSRLRPDDCWTGSHSVAHLLLHCPMLTSWTCSLFGNFNVYYSVIF